ncbi:P-loop containing nucleoside triphosphate hydrolase protein [Cokeromyces recurvatus]|uniref:P-loop containing nucleoside triphosphate hydrolase protein n=1 Tax=Cokeromyces recurvatus TaxID=90255 RepID=UPI00221FEA12|nr:P-loop containing nucleoside triphosphate hydrolase protein [Cokeromyces recurvatus]KAI7902270.1 P-loop containing nucleoside triphosphate hydrolase protein [Cokeromyces recurvatus]
MRSNNDRIREQRESLPTFDYKNELIDAIREYNILVVIGETGSGKTTQIPQYILEEMSEIKKIGVTQPRRIAAITVAKRVSEEQDVRLGSKIGYTIRFDDRTTDSTQLKYMTDGILLREATMDPKLSQYDVIIIDEAHERTLDTDVLFGLLKQTHQLRPDLKILIMSATLDVTKFSDFFGGCPIFEIPGRTYPVEVVYPLLDASTKSMASLKSAMVDRAVEQAWKIHCREPKGDILVFLTGQQDIERACKQFLEKERGCNYQREVRFYDHGKGVSRAVVYPLYASLETYDQKAVFELPRENERKIVFATNVAQTSVTIPGIRYVVDSGFAKEKSYDPNTGMDALLVTEISQAAAIQRAGRAGRTAPGKAFRLYSEESFEHMLPNTIPEIQRSSLMSTVLSLKTLNIVDVLHFEFIDPPEESLVRNALKQLYLLGAIDENGRITKLGHQMSSFPLSPPLARILIASSIEYGCSYEVLIIVSMMAGDLELFKTVSPQQRRRIQGNEDEENEAIRAEACKLKFAHHTGDHMTCLNVWHEWKRHDKSRQWCKENYINPRVLEMAENVRSQLIDVMDKLHLKIIHAPTIINKHKKKSSHKRRHVGENESGDNLDPVPILKSFLTGYFTNIANKGAHRSVFSHYSPDQHLTTSEEISSTALVALYLHPQCALASELLDRNKIQYADLDWVMYTNVTYTNKAVMKGVSKIVWDWVKQGEGQSRIKKLPQTRLNGEGQASTETLDIEAEEELKKKKLEEIQKKEEFEELKRKEEEENNKRRRAKEIDMIRQRALARRRQK